MVVSCRAACWAASTVLLVGLVVMIGFMSARNPRAVDWKGDPANRPLPTEVQQPMANASQAAELTLAQHLLTTQTALNSTSNCTGITNNSSSCTDRTKFTRNRRALSAHTTH